MIDFTVGGAAGRNPGRLPEKSTITGMTWGNVGTVLFYGAVGPDEEAEVPSQRADLPRGTLTGMQIQFSSTASPADRKVLLDDVALYYVNALNAGDDKTWSPHAMFPLKSVAEVAAKRSSTNRASVLDRSL